jgi:pimeloyl-ACP methyl ester carboxylesterase
VSARPHLVLLPGLDGTGILFQWLTACLPPDIAVTVVRYPDDPSLGYDDYVDQARHAIGSQRVVVLGESFSGPIAIKLAASMPDQICGLILAATFLKSPWPPVLVRRAASVNPHRAPRFSRDWVLMGHYKRAEVSEQLDTILRNLTPGLRAARLQAVAAIDVRSDFDCVLCPVLALHGRDDWVVPPGTMRRAIASKSGAHMEQFSAAHMLLQTAPQLAACAIASFMAEIQPAS